MRLLTPDSEDLDLQSNKSWSGDEAPVEFIIGNTGEAFLYSFEECKTQQVCILVPLPRQLSESNILTFLVIGNGGICKGCLKGCCSRQS
jgi:hypothetical protein